MVQFYPRFKFFFFCFKLIIIHYHTQKQKKRKFKSRIKLNHNIHTFEPVHPSKENGNWLGGVTIRSTLLTALPPLPCWKSSVQGPAFLVEPVGKSLSNNANVVVVSWNIQKQYWSRLSMWPTMCLSKRENIAGQAHQFDFLPFKCLWPFRGQYMGSFFLGYC